MKVANTCSQEGIEIVQTVHNRGARQRPPTSPLELVACFGYLRRAVLDVMGFVEDNAEELV